MLVNYLFAAAIGATAGGVELLQRYRDAPWRTMREAASFFYLLLNAIASTIAYHLVLVFDVRFGLTAPAQVAAVQVMVAGLAAVAFFRTTLFTVKSGDSVIEIGPSAMMEALLTVTDRTIDRSRAERRATDVPVIMAGVDFPKASEALPAFCFGAMQNVTDLEQKAAREAVTKIAGTSLSNGLKVNLLGLLLVNLSGLPVLRTAVKALDAEIR